MATLLLRLLPSTPVKASIPQSCALRMRAATGCSVTKPFNYLFFILVARITFPRTVGFGAGLLALVLIVFAIFGLLWGLWRPEMTATAVEGGGFAIDTTSNAQFQGFGAFVLATALLAGA